LSELNKPDKVRFVLHLLLHWHNDRLVGKRCQSAQHLLQATGRSVSFGQDDSLRASHSEFKVLDTMRYTDVEEAGNNTDISDSSDKVHHYVEPNTDI